MINVVVVEGDNTLAKLYQEELEEAGFSVRVRQDLVGAVAELRRSPAHVLVTDMATMGCRPEAWLPNLREVFAGPVVALDHSLKNADQCSDLSVVRKSSDLRPLIKYVRSQALKTLWSHAAATC
jgi:DNA-binding response OmpR family regulator